MSVICGRGFSYLSLVLLNLDGSRVSLIGSCTLLDGEGMIIAGCVRQPFRFPRMKVKVPWTSVGWPGPKISRLQESSVNFGNCQACALVPRFTFGVVQFRIKDLGNGLSDLLHPFLDKRYQFLCCTFCI